MADTTTPIAKLPFVTAPKQSTKQVGNEEIGILEFPVYRDLTVNEAAWLQSNSGAKTAFTYTSHLALKIAKAEKVQPIEAHAFVARVLAAAMGTNLEMSGREQTWCVKYVRELEETAMKVLEVSVQTQNNLVTCVIRHRLPNMEEWGPSDTANLPSELVEEIYKFALSEQARGEHATVETAQEEISELLGKSPTELMTPTKGRRGTKSSTSSATSSRETPTSPESASED